MSTQHLTYEGGIQSVDVVLPTRTLTVSFGDEVEVTAAEAEALKNVPGFAPRKTTTKKEQA
jgi:hypothetical protein